MEFKGRYDHLSRGVSATVGNTADRSKPYRILEVGVWTGQHAAKMIRLAASLGRKSVEYHGFDLFELMEPGLAKAEVHSKRTPSEREVEGFILRDTLKVQAAIKVVLHKGHTGHTLSPGVKKLPPMDFVFVDGGHSVSTIVSDFRGVIQFIHAKSRILLDDLYAGDYTKGAQALVDILKHSPVAKYWQVDILDPQESFPVRNDLGQVTGELKINMVSVRPSADFVADPKAAVESTSSLLTQKLAQAAAKQRAASANATSSFGKAVAAMSKDDAEPVPASFNDALRRIETQRQARSVSNDEDQLRRQEADKAAAASVPVFTPAAPTPLVEPEVEKPPTTDPEEKALHFPGLGTVINGSGKPLSEITKGTFDPPAPPEVSAVVAEPPASADPKDELGLGDDESLPDEEGAADAPDEGGDHRPDVSGA